jgi:hypothetical protein
MTTVKATERSLRFGRDDQRGKGNGREKSSERSLRFGRDDYVGDEAKASATKPILRLAFPGTAKTKDGRRQGRRLEGGATKPPEGKDAALKGRRYNRRNERRGGAATATAAEPIGRLAFPGMAKALCVGQERGTMRQKLSRIGNPDLMPSRGKVNRLFLRVLGCASEVR